MKKISEHLGEIIVALAGVALLVAAVVVFKAPIGEFYNSMLSKETSITDTVLEGMDNINLSDLTGGGAGGSDGAGGSGGETEEQVDLNPTGVIPTGAYYLPMDGDLLGPGEAFPEPEYDDMYFFGDYYYYYEMKSTGVAQGREYGWNVDFINEGIAEYLGTLGVNITVPDPNQTSYGPVLESIAGREVKWNFTGQ